MAVQGFEPHFDIDFQRGKVGEDSHESFLNGKHEVKTDYKISETGNIYIEYAQQNYDGSWRPSGINVTESDFWVQASPKGVAGFYVTTQYLRDFISRHSFPTGTQPIKNEVTNASVGHLVPISALLRDLGLLD